MLKWPFSCRVLTKFGFGQSFINCATTLYHNPQAKITANGQMSAASLTFCVGH